MNRQLIYFLPRKIKREKFYFQFYKIKLEGRDREFERAKKNSERKETRGTKWRRRRRKRKKWNNSDSTFSWNTVGSTHCSSSPMAILETGVVHSSEKLLREGVRGRWSEISDDFSKDTSGFLLIPYPCVSRGSRDRRSKGRPEFHIKSFVARKF